MKAKTLQILWHGKEPVWSVDFHKDGYLATSGADKEIKLWKVELDADGFPCVRHLETLTGHNKGINTVRFSPSGDMLASGGDAGEIMLWKPTGCTYGRSEEVFENFTWKTGGVLRGHNDDVQDLSWAPQSNSLMSGSVDNSSIVWDTIKAKAVMRMADHRHYVQGVAWDPAGQFLVTQSGDRTCRVYSPVLPTATGKKGKPAVKPEDWGRYLTCMHTLSKRDVEESSQPEPKATNAEGNKTADKECAPDQEVGKVSELPSTSANDNATDDTKENAKEGTKPKALKQCLFHDDTVPSLFRRLAWAPDGSFLALPTGLYKRDSSAIPQNTLYMYSRKCFTKPAAHVPGFNTPVVAIRFCPVLFTLLPEEGARSSSNPAVFDAPYRIIFAVASIDSVVIMDTQRMTPLALVGGLHYTSITDLAWASDGSMLVVSSSDGFCSVVVFEAGELGTPLPVEEIPQHVKHIMFPAALSGGTKDATAAASKPTHSEPNQAPVRPKKAPDATACPPAEPLLESRNTNAQSLDIKPNGTSFPENAASTAKRRITPMAVVDTNVALVAVPGSQGEQTHTDLTEALGKPVAPSVQCTPTPMQKEGGPRRITPVPVTQQAGENVHPCATGKTAGTLVGTEAVGSKRRITLTPLSTAAVSETTDKSACLDTHAGSAQVENASKAVRLV